MADDAPAKKRKRTSQSVAKTAKGKRVLAARAPRKEEALKQALFLHAGKSSAVVKTLLGDLASSKRGECTKLSRANEAVRPFEAGGEGSLEFLCRKAGAGLFALGSHSKKRPHNLVLGRTFDHQVLDMLEFGVENFRPMKEFGSAAARAAQGSKPCIVFLGDWETDATLRVAKSLLLDFFRGRVVPSVNLRGLDRVILLTAAPSPPPPAGAPPPPPGAPPRPAHTLLLRQCVARLKKSGGALPRVELTEMGPRADLVPRRARAADPELRRRAHAAAAAPRKARNTADERLVGRVGRVFAPSQGEALDGLALKKGKGLKRGKREAAAEGKRGRREAAAAGGGGGGGGGGDGGGGGGGERGGAARARVRREGRGGGGGGGDAGGGAGGGAGYELSEGNVVAGRGLKKGPKKPRRAA